MKSKLCSVLLVLSVAVLSATVVHADEPDAVGAKETVSETDASSETDAPDEPVDPVTALRDRNKGTGLMTAAFVAQGISLGTTFASIFVVEIMYFNWVIQASTIPFAPMGVGGFALRYGGSSESRRLRWTGIGLLEAAAFAAVVGGVNLAAHSWLRGRRSEGAIFGYPGTISHFGASIAFVIAGAVCVGVAKAQERRQGLSQSRRPPARGSHRGFVMPTIAPRPGGLSLGLIGVF